MNTLEIADLLNSNNFTKNIFKGVYAINKIPKRFNQKPCCIIVNYDTDKQPGSHQIAVFFPKKGCAEFFDSYGNQTIKNNVIKHISKNTKMDCFIRNAKRLQGTISTVCGQYCCVYLWFRCKGYSLRKFINIFTSTDYSYNDKLVLKLYNRIFKT